MANPLRGLNSFGYDAFAGREVSCKSERLVILDFAENDAVYFNTPAEWVKEICSYVREGDSVLLTKSPGKIGRRVTSSYSDAMDIVKILAQEAPQFTCKVNKDEMNRLKKYRKVHPAVEYLPLARGKLIELRNILDAVLPYSNPFDNQP
jgi:hypothetical protein